MNPDKGILIFQYHSSKMTWRKEVKFKFHCYKRGVIVNNKDRINPDQMIETLLRAPYWIVDLLPEQVPLNTEGQYAAVEQYYLQEERLRLLRRKYAELLLRLNCYYDMVVSFDGGNRWTKNPNPEAFARALVQLPGNAALRILYLSQETMIDFDGMDTYLTIYHPSSTLLERIRLLANAVGLFVWKGREV